MSGFQHLLLSALPQQFLLLLRERATHNFDTAPQEDHVPSRGVATASLSRVSCMIRLPGTAG